MTHKSDSHGDEGFLLTFMESWFLWIDPVGYGLILLGYGLILLGYGLILLGYVIWTAGHEPYDRYKWSYYNPCKMALKKRVSLGLFHPTYRGYISLHL